MSEAKPTRTKTDAKRAPEAEPLAAKLTGAMRVALSNPSHQQAWADVAAYAGNVQRRARLLAGLGRGG